jgi:galactoside O-acetyltransferase
MSETNNPFDQGYFGTEELDQMGFSSVGRNVKIAKNATLIGLHNISIGNFVRIDGGVVIVASSGSLILGNYIHIGAGSYLGCAGGLQMDDFSCISQGVRIYSASDDYSGNFMTNPTVSQTLTNIQFGRVHLGKHVIVGSGTVILPGSSIGEGSAIGSLSLVNKSLAPWGIFSGIPARLLKTRSRELLEKEKLIRKEL